MIIDIHTHHYLGLEDIKHPKPVEPLMSLAKQAGITRVNLLGNLMYNGEIFRPPYQDVININTITINQVTQYPDFLSGFCYLNPALDPKFLLEEIDRCIVEGNLSGLKFEIDLNCRDARYDPVMERICELDIPILHHSWGDFNGRITSQPHSSIPADVADLAKRFPEANIIMAHLAGVGIRGVIDVANCPNVYIDTSGGQPIAGLVEYAVSTIGADRILYGSDVNIRDFPSQLARVQGAKIFDEDKEKILWRNAARLLKLNLLGEKMERLATV